MFGKFLLVFVHENILSNVERDAVFSDGWVSISVVCVWAFVWLCRESSFDCFIATSVLSLYCLLIYTYIALPVC